MQDFFSERFKSKEDARLWAQIVAFSPFVFQTALSLRNFGLLKKLSLDMGTEFAELQKVADLSEYSLSVLLDAGTSIGLLHETENLFYLTLAGEFVEKDALTQVNMNFTKEFCYKGLPALEDSLRKGTPEGLKVFGNWPTVYEGLTQIPDKPLKSWLEFDHYFSDDCFPKALGILFQSKPKSILDVGGNTGKFAMACAEFDSEVKVTIVDHSEQLKIAEKNVDARGLSKQVRFIPMNLLNHENALPKNHDVIWMSQFLDCFSKEDITSILKRARSAMSATSSLYIMETFIDRQRYRAGRFCLDMTSLYFTCFANGNSRMYRATDFEELIGKAGLKIVEEIDYIRLSHSILKCQIKQE